MPPGTASAMACRSARRSCGYGGGTNPPRRGRAVMPSATVLGLVGTTNSLERGDVDAAGGGPAPACRPRRAPRRAPRRRGAAPRATSPRSYGHPSSHDRRQRTEPRRDRVERACRPRRRCAADTATAPRCAREQVGDLSRIGDVGLVDHEQLGHRVGADLAQHRRAPPRSGPRRRAREPSTTCTSEVGVDRPPRASTGTPRRAGAGAGARTRRCRRAARSRRRGGAGGGWWDRASRTGGPRRARRRAVSRLSSVDFPAFV